jgi:hypothetical protein
MENQKTNKKTLIFTLIFIFYVFYIPVLQTSLFSYAAERLNSEQTTNIELILEQIFELNSEIFKKLQRVNSDQEVRIILNNNEKEINKYIPLLLKDRTESIRLAEKYLFSTDDSERSTAVYLLSKLNAKQSYKALLNQLEKEKNVIIYGNIILSLGEIKAKEALPFLERLSIDLTTKKEFSVEEKERIKLMIQQTQDTLKILDALPKSPE